MSNKLDSEFPKKIIACQQKSDKIRNSEGYKCFHYLLKFKMLYFIYRSNTIAWNKVLKEYYSDDRNVTANSLKRFFRQKRIITTIHNILASATSFIEIYEENQIADTFHCFIKELRNYITHTDYFPLTSKWTLNEERNDKFESFQVDKFKSYLTNRIKEHPNWNGLKLALKFTESLPEPIDFNNILFEYDLKINEFYKEYIKNHIRSNKDCLLKLIKETEAVHSKLDDIKVVPSYPISQVRLRYLKYILKNN